ncbi:MAG: Omp28 family outer membrane lipoprotein [Bacteroidales bacterium]|nr:Omp28 family outer membrane lipoprotein [Bacteroidales bacterium]
MKNLLKLSLIIFIVLFSACDVIEGPYIEGSTTGIDTTEKIVKKVLIEEYTGHLCINCPTAALIIHDLKQLYGIQLTVIAVHSGYNATLAAPNFMTDFRTPVGNDLNSFFNIGDIAPKGVVNRTKFNNSYALDKDAWGSAISEILAKELEANIKVEKTYNSVDSTVSITTNLEFFSEISDPIKLSAYFTEDNIIDYQKNNNAEIGATPEIPDYAHMHVLRGALNNTWGDEILPSGSSNGLKTSKTIHGKLPNNIKNVDNVNLVVFIYNANTMEIIQVEEVKLK